MANPHKGEVSLKVGDETYTLVLTINSICDVEEETGRNLIGDLTRLATLRLMLYAALKEKHPAITVADAGNIIGAVGGGKVMEAVSTALKLALAKPKDNGEAKPNP